MPCLIGLDIGTSGAKCIIADEKGDVLKSVTVEYPLYTPKPGWAEQEPSDWWKAVCEGCRKLTEGFDGSRLVGLSLSGQMHGLVALDKGMQVLRPSILWCDQRTQAQCDEIKASVGGRSGLVKLTNNDMLTGYTGGKLLWMKENEPENYEKLCVFMCPKDYIRFMLTGEAATDVSDASGTGLYEVKNRRWCDHVISASGLDRSYFPKVLESSALAGQVTKQAAELTGLPEGLNVYAGGGDAVIQNTGAGLIKKGTLGVVIGTAGNVSMGLSEYADNPDGKLQLFCGNDRGLYQAFGCTQTAGGAYRWYRDTLAKGTDYRTLDEMAETSPIGSNGVVFLPYLIGERCPYPDADARGVFYGLSLSSNQADMTRSVMEGVTFSLKQVVDIMKSFCPCEKVFTSGGGARSKLWRQMQADIFDLPVYTQKAAGEGGAYGAVMVAGVGSGVWSSLEEAAGLLQTDTETLPIRENTEKYREAYAVYDALYPALKNVWSK